MYQQIERVRSILWWILAMQCHQQGVWAGTIIFGIVGAVTLSASWFKPEELENGK